MADSNGFYVAITNNSILPNVKNEGIEVTPGTSANIGIQRSFYYKMTSPYGDCRSNPDTPSISDSDLFRKTAKISRYTRNLCYEVCFQYRYAIAECACAEPSIDSNVNNVTSCTLNNAKCITNLEKTFDSSECDSDCPEVCERVEYLYRVSQADYPSK